LVSAYSQSRLLLSLIARRSVSRFTLLFFCFCKKFLLRLARPYLPLRTASLIRCPFYRQPCPARPFLFGLARLYYQEYLTSLQNRILIPIFRSYSLLKRLVKTWIWPLSRQISFGSLDRQVCSTPYPSSRSALIVRLDLFKASCEEVLWPFL
jgi:hypothetical protein